MARKYGGMSGLTDTDVSQALGVSKDTVVRLREEGEDDRCD